MGKIFKFDPQIYPLMVWVTVKPTISQLSERFVILKEDNVTEVEITDDSIKPYWGACRLTVIEKETRHTGSLIAIMRPNACTDRTLVHEASHAYDDFADLLNLPYDGETRSYLTEWIFQMAKDVFKGKVK